MIASIKVPLRGALVFLLFVSFSTTYGQTLSLTNSDIGIISDGMIDDNACPHPPTGPEIGNCNFIGATLQPGVNNSQFSNNCGYRRVKTDLFPSCHTSCSVNHFYALNGSGTTDMTIDWMNGDYVFHDTEQGVGYVATTLSNAHLIVDIDLNGVPTGTKVKVYYSYEVYAGALGVPELGEPDLSAVNPNLLIDGLDLLAQANYNFNFNTGGGVGFLQRGSAAGFFFMTAGQSSTIDISTNQSAAIFPSGISHAHMQGGLFWKDFGTAVYRGTLNLSVNPLNPVNPPTPLSAWNYWSIDIGSASEFSDPLASGTEYFDPGDAYEFMFPHPMPLGGLDGPIDDENLIGSDMAPSAPDVPVPHTSAAPVASGLPLTSVINNYFDLDALDLVGFDLNLSDIPLPFPISPTDCLLPIRHLFVSLDDDASENYLEGPPTFGAPNNSLSVAFSTEYGTFTGRDELLQQDFLPLAGLPPVVLGIATEGMVHPDLLPLPDPNDLAVQEDDDVDALDLKSSNGDGGCDVIYFSSDHEAPGQDFINGVAIDPGVIYRSTPGGVVPAVVQPDLGLLPGVDIDAFEFGVMPTPANPYGPGYLALLFSVDADDPATLFIDESGGLSPSMVYWSYMDGVHYALDSTDYEENIDAISLTDESQFNITGAQYCNPYNFVNPPTGLNVSVGGGAATFTWDPYLYGEKCQLSGNKSSVPNDVKKLVSGTALNPPTAYTMPLSQLASGTTYRVKVRCGCNFPAVQASPFTSYVSFSTPGPPPSPNEEDYDMFAAKDEVSIYPNPASELLTVSLPGVEGQTRVRVRDALGRTVLDRTVSSESWTTDLELDVSGLKPGPYVVDIAAEGLTKSLKLVVAR